MTISISSKESKQNAPHMPDHRMQAKAAQAFVMTRAAELQRMACAITGRAEAGPAIVAAILPNGVAVLATSDDPATALRYFYQQTLRLARQAGAMPDPQQDALWLADGAQDPEFMAFMRAIRRLSPTQREAYLLNVGEGWPFRLCAQVMEGSTNGVERQCAAGEELLRQATGERYDALKLRLAAAYQKLTPTDTDAYLPAVRTAVKAAEWPQVKARLGGWIVAGVAVLLAAGIWQYYGPLLAWWQKLTG